MADIVVKGAFHIADFLLHGAVPVVLDGVVGSAFKDFCDFSPSVAEFSMEKEEDPLLNLSPFAAFVAWVQMVMPSLPAVLSKSIWKLFSDQSPFLGSNGLN